MTRQKIGVIVGAPLVALLLIGGGFAIGHGVLDRNKVQQDLEQGSSSAGTADASAPVSLNQASGAAAASPSGLSVSSGSSGASNLGQLNNQSSNSQSSSSGSGSSSGANSSSDPNPSTFASYDQYKDQQNALFGDIAKGTGDTKPPPISK